MKLVTRMSKPIGKKKKEQCFNVTMSDIDLCWYSDKINRNDTVSQIVNL
jgi:hypothetical protein